MVDLTEAELRLRIVGCGDGPASFNAEATRRGTKVISSDPIYRWETAQIRDRIAATYDEILDQTRRNADEFVWDSIRSVETATDRGKFGHAGWRLRRSTPRYNQRFQYRRAPCVLQPRYWSASD